MTMRTEDQLMYPSFSEAVGLGEAEIFSGLPNDQPKDTQQKELCVCVYVLLTKSCPTLL